MKRGETAALAQGGRLSASRRPVLSVPVVSLWCGRPRLSVGAVGVEAQVGRPRGAKWLCGPRGPPEFPRCVQGAEEQRRLSGSVPEESVT